MHRLAQWVPARLRSPHRRSPQGSLGRRNGRDRVRLGVERLEERTLLSGNPTIAWDGGAGDFEWFTPLNWTEDRLPNPNDDVLIQVPGQQATITVSGSPTVRSLQSEENLQLAGGWLTLAADSAVSGSLAGFGALIADGSLSVQNLSLISYSSLSGSGTVTVTGTFDWYGGSMGGTGETVIAPGATLWMHNGAFAGRYLEERTLSNAGTVRWLGDVLFAQFGNGGLFRNLAGGVVRTAGGYVATSPSSYPIGLRFENAGTFIIEGAADDRFQFIDVSFTNSGVVEVQSGALLLDDGSATGSFAISSLATLDFTGSYTLQAGASFQGTGLAQIVQGSLTVQGNVTIPNLVLRGHLSGPGTVTVAGSLTWFSGSMSGDGKTAIASGGMLDLRGDDTRYLFGRRIINQGGTTWDGAGAITRYAGSLEEIFDNTGVPRQPPPAAVGPAPSACRCSLPGPIRPLPSTGAFNPIALAGQLGRAMFGGLTGLGTTEELVYAALGGLTVDQINAVRTAYANLYRIDRGTPSERGRDLDQDLLSEFSGEERRRVEALLAGNSVRADATALWYAMFGGTGAGTDSTTIYRILERGPVAAIEQEYQQLYGENPRRDNALRQDLASDLSGLQLDRANYLLDGNRAAADAAGLRYAMFGGLGLDIDEDEIYRILRDRTPDQIAAIRSEYQRLYGENPHRDNALEADLAARLDPSERDYATALLEGDPIEVGVTRLRLAFDQDGDGSTADADGTDEDAVWQTLEGTTSDRRAMFAQRYRQRYGVELRQEYASEFSNTTVYGPELTRTITLHEKGGFSLAERVYFAVRGWGTDDVAIPRILAELGQLSPEQIAAIDAQYQGLSGGESLRDGLDGDLDGRDWFRAQQALQGRPDGLLGEAQRILDFYDWERSGWTNWINNGAQFVFNDHGADLDAGVERLRTRVQEYRDDPTSAREAALREALEQVRQYLQTFQEARDSAADIFANVLTTAAAVGVAIFSAGTLTPVAILVYSTIGAATQVVPRLTIGGQTYELEALPADLIVGGLTVGTAPFAVFRAAPGVSRVNNVLRGALSGGGDGAIFGFAQGALETSLQEETWANGFTTGLMRIGEGGVVSALIGAPTGASVGSLLGALRRVRPPVRGEARPGAGALHPYQHPSGVDYFRYEPGDPVPTDPVLARVHQRMQDVEVIGYGVERRVDAQRPHVPLDDETLLRFLNDEACGYTALAMEDAARTGVAQPVIPQSVGRRAAGTPRDIMNATNGEAPISLTGPKATAQSQMVQTLTEAGDGARGIVYFARENGTAHFVVLENIGGEVWAFGVMEGVAVPMSGPRQTGADAFLRVFDVRPGDVGYRPGWEIIDSGAMDLIITHRPPSP